MAALVTLLLQQPGAAPRGISGIRCITIGPPAVLSQELCGLCEEYVTSIVLGADPIPRLRYAHSCRLWVFLLAVCGLCEEYVTSFVLGADPIPRLRYAYNCRGCSAPVLGQCDIPLC